MGWNAQCVVLSKADPGYIAGCPPHDPGLADSIVEGLDLGPYDRQQLTSLHEGIYPTGSELFVGAYEHAALIGHDELTMKLALGTHEPGIEKLLSFYPGARILAIYLQSSVNQAGYALFESGGLRRSLMSSQDPEVGIFDDGDPLEEELPILSTEFTRDGESFYRLVVGTETVEVEPWEIGEELVFEVSRRVFGSRLDTLDISQLTMERFTPRAEQTAPRRRGIFGRLFGRS